MFGKVDVTKVPGVVVRADLDVVTELERPMSDDENWGSSPEADLLTVVVKIDVGVAELGKLEKLAIEDEIWVSKLEVETLAESTLVFAD